MVRNIDLLFMNSISAVQSEVCNSKAIRAPMGLAHQSPGKLPDWPHPGGPCLHEFRSQGLQFSGEVDVLLCDTSGIVSGEVDGQAIIYVEPLGMMFHFFSDQCRHRHETEGMDEIGKLIVTMELIVGNGPSADFVQGGCDFRFG